MYFCMLVVFKHYRDITILVVSLGFNIVQVNWGLFHYFLLSNRSTMVPALVENFFVY